MSDFVVFPSVFADRDRAVSAVEGPFHVESFHIFSIDRRVSRPAESTRASLGAPVARDDSFKMREQSWLETSLDVGLIPQAE